MSAGLEEKRFDKIENAIDKLTQVSADLSKIVAVQELRIVQQEKLTTIINEQLERRRLDVDEKINAVKEQIVGAVKEVKEETNSKYALVEQKLSKLERWSWMAIGGGAAIGMLLNIFLQFLKTFL